MSRYFYSKGASFCQSDGAMYCQYSQCLHIENSEQADRGQPVFLKERGSEAAFCGLRSSCLLVNVRCILNVMCSSCHLSWTATHFRLECSWWKNFYIYQRKRGIFIYFLFFSKTTVVGDLTLQVLLIWTVSSLGGFPSCSPQPHPCFSPRPTPANINRGHTSRIFCLYLRKTTGLGTQRRGGHDSLSEPSGVLAKWNPCDENDQI